MAITVTKDSDTRVISPAENGNTEKVIDNFLRPKTLGEYVGQEKIKSNLNIFLEAAKKRGEAIEHVLLYGPPGLGKTTLASIIASEMGSSIRTTSGAAIDRTADLASILTNLQAGDILFIDEIHRLRSSLEEVLYSAMEDNCLDIILGKGPSARTMRIDLPPITIIGATTKFSALSAPLRDRFGSTYKLEFYSDKEIGQIIGRSATILNVEIDDKAVSEISSRSRRTPRVANRLLRRIRDFAEVKHEGAITNEIASQGLEELRVDKLGLDHADLEILDVLINKFGGGPVGLNTLAAATSEEESTIEDVYEPFLLQLGFIERTPRGRVATQRAYEHMGLQKISDKGTLFDKTNN